MTTPVASPTAAAIPTRRRFTVAEYYAMADAGILYETTVLSCSTETSS